MVLLYASVWASVSDGASVICSFYWKFLPLCRCVSLCFSVCLQLSSPSFLSFRSKHEKGPKMSENSLSGICSALFSIWCNPKKGMAALGHVAFSLMPCPLLLRNFSVIYHLRIQFKAALLNQNFAPPPPRFLYNFVRWTAFNHFFIKREITLC